MKGTVTTTITTVKLNRMNYTRVGSFTSQAQTDALERISFESMTNYVRNTYEDCKAVSIIAGNIKEQNAIA